MFKQGKNSKIQAKAIEFDKYWEENKMGEL